MLVRPAGGEGHRRRSSKGQSVVSGGSLVQNAEGLAQEFSEGNLCHGKGEAPHSQGFQTEVRNVAERLGGRPAVAA